MPSSTTGSYFPQDINTIKFDHSSVRCTIFCVINKHKNIVYIDGANLHNGIDTLGWRLDYRRFRIWLNEKYGVKTAYLFIGMMPKYKDLYTRLQEYGYTLIFKEVTYDKSGKPKGNCDADLVVKAMEDTFENSFEKALLVSSDGDYASLVKFMLGKEKFEVILSPSVEERCSVLLKRTDAKIVYLNDKRPHLELT
ncbi:MAG: NYN domain protein [Ignavibacteria bacterium ADurb.Bin266]|jgi:uncharacterized LabA/DUF88 family protein|nr:MAG: NYN domain protein [Ignavibacteria bacterium ADurb.Bin266]